VRVLFLMRHSGYLRNFESTLRLLAERGHAVHVAFELEERAVLRGTSQMERLSDEQPNITHGPTPQREHETWFEFIAPVRRAIDYLRFLAPEYDDAPKLRARAARGVPGPVLEVAASPARRPRLGRVLRALDLAVPPSRAVDAFIRTQDPDLMLVTPLVGLGSPQGDYVRAAKALGVRTGLCVASWDNLTNKGLIRDVPDVVTVWNEPQRREAIEMHGVRPEAVVATGAQAYDHWFDWRADRTRAEFAAEVGLREDRPFLLYLCSSPFIAPDEVGFVREWVRRLREDPVLGEFGVLVRPHPQNAAQWRGVDLSELGEAVVFPKGGANPVDTRSKADFFNSIHHCEAVVGVNTSALIESAVVGRPVFTVLAAQFVDTQEGTLHFQHLVNTGGGFLSVASTFEEHLEQLADAVGPDGSRDEALARARRFLETFVRPNGLDQPATPRLAGAIETAASAPRPSRRARPGWAVALGVVLTPVAHVVTRWARAQQLVKRTVLREAGRHLPERVKEPLRAWLSIPEAPAPALGDGRPGAASGSNGAVPRDPEGALPGVEIAGDRPPPR